MTETPPTPADLTAELGAYDTILRRWAAVQPEALALRDDGGELSWGAMDEALDRIAARLVETGLERGQSVAILGYSSLAYALVFLAAVRAGGVAAPLTTSASPEQLAGMAADSGARHIFIDRAKLTELGEDCFPGMERTVLDEELESWMAPAGAAPPAFAPQPGDPFNIIYSSGTTGTPKGIVHSHLMRWRQFATTAASYRASEAPVRALASTPLYSNTTMVAFLAPLLAGGTVTVMAKFDALRWLEIAQAQRITHTMLVPVQYRRLMQEPRFDEFDLSACATNTAPRRPSPPSSRPKCSNACPAR